MQYRSFHILLSTLRSFGAARRGAVAVLFAVMIIPLILATGTAVDFARLEILKTSLQSVVDGAALAGASALNLSNGSSSAITVATDYYTKGVASLATTATVGAPTVTVPSSIEVTVSTTATLQYSFMGLIGSGLSVPITASAEGPPYVIQVTKTGGFTSSAYDSDSVYFYIVTGGALPATTASMNLLFTNDSSVDSNYQTDNGTAKAIRVSANDQIGFALVNKTGAITYYSPNGYGAAGNSVHYFYSSSSPPSSVAYPTQGNFYTGVTTTKKNKNGSTTTTCSQTRIGTTVTNYVSSETDSCNAHPCTTLNGSTVQENNLLVNGACSTPSTAVRTCLQLQANPVAYSWNDMGGGSDDYDYNDAAYTVSCVVATASSATAPPSVVALVN
ncbi:TadE/TadG family type IV pilus assembly protein [Lichenicola sp.]|uniref:TadE/TadG family type IV pilus assembly protein n=1 Tax=Lichenicola sp. TaxID=2804529 RepID=UPI003AFFFDBE